MAAWPYNTTRWQALRRAHLSIEPLCRDCLPRAVVASHVDHIHAISAGGEPFPSHDGLASLCLPCHSRKTARGPEAGAVRSTQPRKGCDANGNPIDAAHPWSGGNVAKGGPSKGQAAPPIGPPPNLRAQLVSNDTKRRCGNG